MNPFKFALRILGRGALALPVLYMGFITFLSHLPGDGDHGVLFFGTTIDIHYGNLLHIPLYYVLGILWKVALTTVERLPRANSLHVILLTGGFGILDEFHQSFVPGRYPSVLDVGSNCLGAILACWSWPALRPWLIARRDGLDE
jgi:hypothetical protein